MQVLWFLRGEDKVGLSLELYLINQSFILTKNRLLISHVSHPNNPELIIGKKSDKKVMSLNRFI